MREANLIVSSAKGLNLSKATRLAVALRPMHSVVMLRCGERIAGARNILGVVALCAFMGTALEVRAYGEDEEQAVQTVSEILAAPEVSAPRS